MALDSLQGTNFHAAPRPHHAARTGGARGIDGPSVFIVDMNAAREAGGMTIRPIGTMMNHSTTDVFFDNVEVPTENLIGEEGNGLRSEHVLGTPRSY